MNKYEILTYSLCDGWTNTWTTWSDENPEEVVEMFETRAEAEKAIAEEIKDISDAIDNGDMSPDSRLVRNDFKIRKIQTNS